MFMWYSLVGINLGILFAINFTDLTVGMLMVHFFTFDPAWLELRPRIGLRDEPAT